MSETMRPEPTRGSGMALLALVVGVVALVLALFAAFGGATQVPADTGPTERNFALSSDLVEGSNRYHPAILVAFEGDDITFSVTNRGNDTHGFTVEGLGIADVVDEGESAEFNATGVEAGVYRYFCHLHPGHIPGQLVVLGR